MLLVSFLSNWSNFHYNDPMGREKNKLYFSKLHSAFNNLRTSFKWLVGFPGGSDDKESTFNAGNLGSVPGSERSPGEGKGNPLQHSGLENSMNYSPWGYKELDTTKRLSQCWLLTLCKFHMYNIIFLLVYILQHTHYKKCSFHPSPSS